MKRSVVAIVAAMSQTAHAQGVITISEAVRKTGGGEAIFATITWGISALCLVVCVGAALAAAYYLSHDDYTKGKLAFIGSAIAGMTPELARLFVFSGG